MVEESKETVTNGKHRKSGSKEMLAAADTMLANLAKVKTNVKPLVRHLTHPNHRKGTVEKALRKAELPEEVVPPERKSRSRVKRILRRPARIHRLLVGILLSVKKHRTKDDCSYGDRCASLHAEKSTAKTQI